MKRAIRAVEIGCRVSADLRRNLLSKHRHREERSDAAIQHPAGKAGWLRFADHDDGARFRDRFMSI
jgi:hypothetical protein